MAENIATEQLRGFLGTGWAFPLRVNGRGGIALVADEQAIERSIRLILQTAQGERRVRPRFGCGINEVAFAPINSTTLGLVRHHVLEALGWWEPRISVDDVAVEPGDDDTGVLNVLITYTVKATSDTRSLVYPFYVIPGEQGAP